MEKKIVKVGRSGGWIVEIHELQDGGTFVEVDGSRNGPLRITLDGPDGQAVIEWDGIEAKILEEA